MVFRHNDNDNELFIQTKSNGKHHKGNINDTYKKATLQGLCQGDFTEDIMAASIQPQRYTKLKLLILV